MYIILASVVRRKSFGLYKTTRERDINICRDCFIGEVDPTSKGVRITNF